MPRYQCFKEVWALKIKDIVLTDTGATITPVEDNYAEFDVDRLYMEKHKPTIGGYYVVYEDGYTSFSPAQAFEGGYKLINE